VVQVFAIDIGDDRKDRRELEERPVGLVGLHHQKLTLADAGVRTAHRSHLASDNHGGILAGMIEDRGDHRRGAGLPMAAADGNPELEAH